MFEHAEYNAQADRLRIEDIRQPTSQEISDAIVRAHLLRSRAVVGGLGRFFSFSWLRSRQHLPKRQPRRSKALAG